MKRGRNKRVSWGHGSATSRHRSVTRHGLIHGLLKCILGHGIKVHCNYKINDQPICERVTVLKLTTIGFMNGLTCRLSNKRPVCQQGVCVCVHAWVRVSACVWPI